MKVLKNNYKEFQDCVEKLQKTMIKPYPRKLVCENCGSELEYEESDLRMGALGCMYLDCPCCGRDNMLEENENTITLTANNVEFPTHFFHTSKENGAVDVSDDEIKKFQPSQEVDDAEDVIQGNRTVDITDIIDKIIERTMEDK